MERNEYFLSIDMDTGEIEVMPVTTPMESVPFGCFIPHITGTREQMEQRKRELINTRIKKARKIKKVNR